MEIYEIDEKLLPEDRKARSDLITHMSGHGNLLTVAGALLGFTLYDHVDNFDFTKPLWVWNSNVSVFWSRNGIVGFLVPILAQTGVVLQIETLPAKLVFRDCYGRAGAIVRLALSLAITFYLVLQINNVRGAATFAVCAALYLLHAYHTTAQAVALRKHQAG